MWKPCSFVSYSRSESNSSSSGTGFKPIQAYRRRRRCLGVRARLRGHEEHGRTHLGDSSGFEPILNSKDNVLKFFWLNNIEYVLSMTVTQNIRITSPRVQV